MSELSLKLAAAAWEDAVELRRSADTIDVQAERIRVLREALEMYISAGIGNSTDPHIQGAAYAHARAALEATK